MPASPTLRSHLATSALLCVSTLGLTACGGGGGGGGAGGGGVVAPTWSASAVGLDGAAALSLAGDPAFTDLYVGTRGRGVFRSSDGGANWTPVRSGLPEHERAEERGYAEVYAVAVDPAQTSRVLAGTGRGVFRSEDRGDTFVASTNGLGNRDVDSIAFDPNVTGRVFATVEGQGVYRSTNSGESWSRRTNGLDDRDAICVAVAESVSDTLYVGTRTDVFKSTNGADSFTSTGLGPSDVSALAVDPFDADVVYAGGIAGGLHKTVNGGTDWVSSRNGLPNAFRVTGLAIDRTVTTTIYASLQGGGLYVSTNAGADWVEMDPGFGDLRAVLLNPSNGSRVLTAGYGAGVLGSQDAGTSWAMESKGLDGGEVRKMHFTPGSAQAVFAATAAGLYYSTDAGQNWEARGADLPNVDIVDLDVADAAPAVVAVATKREGAFVSLDRGVVFTQVGPTLPDVELTSIAISPIDQNTIFVGTRFDGLFRSTNGGTDFTQLQTGLTNDSISSIVIAPENAQTVWVSTRGGVFRSTDGGDTFSSRNTGINDPLINVLVMDPEDSQVLFAGSQNQGVFRTTNGGETWRRRDNGLRPDNITGLAISSLDSDLLIAVSPGEVDDERDPGVYISRNHGDNWESLANGLEPTRTLTALARPGSGVILLGSLGGGIFRATLD